MLDPEIPEERREQIASEARKRIESGGELRQDTSWGMRKLAYEIRQRTEADYRLFRFRTGGGLLDELDHNLRIVDGVLRFRIFRVDPGSPAIPSPAPVASSTSTAPRGPRRSPSAPARGEPEAARERAPSPAPEASPEPASQPAAPPEGDGEEPGPAADQGSQPRAAE
jgi:small subunit ribosomal protein S6